MSFGCRKQEQPLHRMEGNTATVKAVAWCPFKSKVLASGGGTGDHRIRVWDTQTGSQLNTLDTGKQVLHHHVLLTHFTSNLRLLHCGLQDARKNACTETTIDSECNVLIESAIVLMQDCLVNM